MLVLQQQMIQIEPFRDTLRHLKLSSFSIVHCAFLSFRDGDTSQARSQWHFIALDADFHCMCRSAFFPDICELSHLFIQSTDTFLGGCLKLRLHILEGPGLQGHPVAFNAELDSTVHFAEPLLFCKPPLMLFQST